MILVYFLIFSMIVSSCKSLENPCYTEVYEFTKVHPKYLSNEKLLYNEREGLPHFQKKCPYFLELDDYEVALYRELQNRSLIDTKEL